MSGPLDGYFSKAKAPAAGPVAGKRRRLSSPDLVEEKEPVAAAAHQAGVRGDSKMAGWLNSLSDEASRSLFRLMLNEAGGGSTTRSTLSVSDQAALSGLTNRIEDCPRDGAWYVRWAQHRISRLEVLTNSKTGNKEHPRWQVRPNGGSSSVAEKIRLRVGEQPLKELQSIVGTGKQAKLLVHHVAYNAKYAGSPGKRGESPIPLDVGSGSSISHLCDTRGCVEPSHLVAAAAHADNMDRQRCNGVLLVVYQSAIIHEVPCKHSVSKDGTLSSEAIDSSCRRLQIVRLPDEAVGFLVTQELDQCESG